MEYSEHDTERKPAAPPDTPPAGCDGEGVAAYTEQLWRALVGNVLARYAGGTMNALPEDGPRVAPELWAALANAALERAGVDYRLAPSPNEREAPLRVHDLSRGGRVIDWGTLVPPASGAPRPGTIDWKRLVRTLADLRFLESVVPKVARFSVLCDPALYPIWIVGRRALRLSRPERPEVGVHFRFLQELTPGREARLYRAITPRWEKRRDRETGVRRWRGRRVEDVTA